MIVRARLLVAAPVLLGGAWLLGGGWRVDRSPAWWSFVLNLAVPVVVIAGAGLSWWALRRSRFPAALDVREGAFVAPPAHLHVAVTTMVLLGFVTFSIGSTLRDIRAGKTDAFLYIVPVVVLVPIVAFVLTPLVLASFRDRPRVEIRPEGLGLFDRFATRVVPWEAITVGPYPWVKPSTSGWPVNRIGVGHRSDLVRRRGWARLRRRARDVPLPPLTATHPAFLAAVVNHYLFHPRYRAAIGTPQEYERLCRALTQRFSAERSRVGNGEA